MQFQPQKNMILNDTFYVVRKNEREGREKKSQVHFSFPRAKAKEFNHQILNNKFNVIKEI